VLFSFALAIWGVPGRIHIPRWCSVMTASSVGPASTVFTFSPVEGGAVCLFWIFIARSPGIFRGAFLLYNTRFEDSIYTFERAVIGKQCLIIPLLELASPSGFSYARRL